jgi:mitochondrial-processing peptidase subunit beta
MLHMHVPPRSQPHLLVSVTADITLIVTPSNIRRDYISTHYTAPRMVIVGAGCIDHDEFVSLADKYFGHLPTHPPAGAIVDADPAVFTGSHKRVLKASDETVHVALAFEGASWTSEHAYSLMLIQTVLGRWDRQSGSTVVSPVARQLAERELCHSFSSFNTCYKDTGLFGFYIVAPPETATEAILTSIQGMQDLCADVDDNELNRAKTQLKVCVITILQYCLNYEQRLPLHHCIASLFMAFRIVFNAICVNTCRRIC